MKPIRLNKKGSAAVVGVFALMAVIAGVKGTGVSDLPKEAKGSPAAEKQVAENEFNENAQAVTSNQNAKTAAAEKSISAEAENPADKQAEAAKPKEEPVKQEPSSDKTAALNQDEFYEDNEYEAVGEFGDPFVMMWPIDGEVVMDFSLENMVYDATLEQYRTSDAVCIAAEVGNEVAACADGTVMSAGADYEKGAVVVIDHGNGWQTTYSQLSDGLCVNEGDTVKKGQLVGYVGEPTKYGVALGSHLEFKVTQDGLAMDPKVALAQ